MTALTEDVVTRCLELYTAFYEEFIKEGQAENDAQRNAISCAFQDALKIYGYECATKVWRSLQSAHVARKSGKILSLDVISAVSSANQSWNKSSGHAFESAFCRVASSALEGYSIKFVLQSELKKIFERGLLRQEDPDISLLKGWIASSVFDVYALKVSDSGQYSVFGCVQCKTSIRDRVTRDREPSMIAMSSFFWSIAVVIDGDFLKEGKFRAMVNGGSADYALNGWHGMYVYSGTSNGDRIHLLTPDMTDFCQHTLAAENKWFKQRQWLNSAWRPEKGA